MTIDFCLPVKNEENILEANILILRDFLIKQNYSFSWKIVVILNNCQDKSESIISHLSNTNPEHIKYISIKPAGKGGALKYYFSISSADIIVFMDVDLAVSLDSLNNLINPLINNEKDLVIGSRLLKDSRVERSLFRSFSSLVYNSLSREYLNHKFFDLQCGFKAFKSEVFLKVKPYLKNDQWFFDTELVLLAKFFKFNIIEIPVNWAENRYKQRVSKVSVYKHAWGFLKNMISLRKQIESLKK